MTLKVLKLIIFIIVALGAAIFISTTIRRSSDSDRNFSPEGGELEVSTSTLNLTVPQKVSTTSENTISENTVKIVKPKPISYVAPPPAVVIEISSKSFEELINSSIIQLYCGYLNGDKTSFSDIARGTGIIISAAGEILTNRHIIYDENLKKIKNDCFVLKGPFPNPKSEKPKIYYSTEIVNYPLTEKFDETFSENKYYNDFALLKIISRPENTSAVNDLLQTSRASNADYEVIEPTPGIFNFLPVDWSYQPKNNDELITLGYGVDATHLANQITSTVGRLSGNIDINKTGKPQILLVGSNATQGFSGGALINPQSKGLVGLISWITSGDEAGQYTVAIFRDFLRTLMLQDLNFDLK